MDVAGEADAFLASLEAEAGPQQDRAATSLQEVPPVQDSKLLEKHDEDAEV